MSGVGPGFHSDGEAVIEPCFITGEMSPDFEESVRLGITAGVRTIHLRSDLLGRKIEEITDEDAERLREVLERHGARVGSLYSPFGKCNIEDQAQVDRHMQILSRMTELANLFDTRLIRTFPFIRTGCREYEPSHLSEYLPLIVGRLRPAVKMAEREDVVMCFEGVGSTLARTGRELRQVADAFSGSPAVGLIWEVDVAWRAGESPSEGYEFVRGLIRDVHVKPNPDHTIDTVGSGRNSYEEAFRFLLADGYEGFATVEHWGSAQGTLDGIRQLRELLARLDGRA